MKQHQAAIQHFSNAIELDPKCIMFYRARGWTYRKSADIAAAVQVQYACSRAPQSPFPSHPLRATSTGLLGGTAIGERRGS